MAIKSVNCFQTSDGQIFKDQAEAIAAELEHTFLNWYLDNVLSGNIAGSRVAGEDLMEWLSDNRNVVMDFLQA